MIMFRKILFSFFLLVCLTLSGAVIVSWQKPLVATPEQEYIGFNVYYGLNSHDYLNRYFVGDVDHCIIYGLDAADYFFSATSVNKLGWESRFADEVYFNNVTNFNFLLPLNLTNNCDTNLICEISFQITRGYEYWIDNERGTNAPITVFYTNCVADGVARYIYTNNVENVFFVHYRLYVPNIFVVNSYSNQFLKVTCNQFARQCAISFYVQPGYDFRLQYSTNLIDWHDLYKVTHPGQAYWQDYYMPFLPQCFFRVVP